MLFGFGNAMVDYTVPLTADNPCLEQINAEKGGFFRTDNATFDLLAEKGVLHPFITAAFPPLAFLCAIIAFYKSRDL